MKITQREIFLLLNQNQHHVHIHLVVVHIFKRQYQHPGPEVIINCIPAVIIKKLTPLQVICCMHP